MQEEVNIPFNEWSLERLADGRKTATTRSKKYSEPGTRFLVETKPGKIQTFEIISITKKKLMTVANEHYDEEGAESPQEFIDQWNLIHPRRKYQPMDEKWFHRFKEV